ncbi:hypothetical protein Tco_1351681 [Tanacetum coccineum]
MPQSVTTVSPCHASTISSKIRPPAGLAAAADELSLTLYLGPKAIPNLFRGGKVTLGLSALRSVESKCKGGVLDDGASDLVWESMIGVDNGFVMEVVVGDNTSTGDDTSSGGEGISGSGGDIGSGDSIGGSGGEGIWGSGDDHGESGDDGGVDIARSLATSASNQTGVGTGAGIEILAIGPESILVKQQLKSWQMLLLPPPPRHQPQYLTLILTITDGSSSSIAIHLRLSSRIDRQGILLRSSSSSLLPDPPHWNQLEIYAR